MTRCAVASICIASMQDATVDPSVMVAPFAVVTAAFFKNDAMILALVIVFYERSSDCVCFDCLVVRLRLLLALC